VRLPTLHLVMAALVFAVGGGRCSRGAPRSHASRRAPVP
jgi:hypothetical protein